MNVECKRCGLGKTRLRHPSLPFDSLPYPTRTIRRRVRSFNHVTTKGKEVENNLWVWGSVPRALGARGSPAITNYKCMVAVFQNFLVQKLLNMYLYDRRHYVNLADTLSDTKVQ